MRCATGRTSEHLRRQGVAELRELWRQAQHDQSPGERDDDVLDRFERKYQAIADAASAPK